MTTLRQLVFLVICVCLPASLFGWGPIGHMAATYVAYERLTPATKSRVRDLLKLNPDFASWENQIPAGTAAEDHDRMIFMIASTWADDIKGEPQYSDDGTEGGNLPHGPSSSQNVGYSDLLRHRYWHFVDTPWSPNHTALPDVPAPNAKTQIAAFRTVLASSQPAELKSYDLVWLLHLIGDIHQPLHASTRVTQSGTNGDAGGNKVSLTGDAASNLHAYWDDLPGSDCKFCNDKIRCVNRAIVFAKNLKTPSSKAGHSSNTATWIRESFNDARTVTYQAPIGIGEGPFTIMPWSNYEVRAYRLAQKRITLAGERLAEVLNTELK